MSTPKPDWPSPDRIADLRLSEAIARYNTAARSYNRKPSPATAAAYEAASNALDAATYGTSLIRYEADPNNRQPDGGARLARRRTDEEHTR